MYTENANKTNTPNTNVPHTPIKNARGDGVTTAATTRRKTCDLDAGLVASTSPPHTCPSIELTDAT